MGYFSRLYGRVIELAEDGMPTADIADRLMLDIDEVEEIVREYHAEYSE